MLIVNAQVFSPVEALQLEYNYLRSFLSYLKKGELKILKDTPIRSVDHGTIYVGLKQLKEITDVTNDYYEKGFLVRVILAHEIAHQLQYLYKDKYLNFDNKLSKVNIELQADIIAGHLSAYTIILNGYKNKKLKEKLKMKALYNAFDLFLKKGVEEDLVGTHPSKNDRLLGFKQGVAFGALYVMNHAFMKTQEMQEVLASDAKELKILFYDWFKTMDFNYGNEDVLNWSYRKAQMITHGDYEAVTDLSCVVNNAKQFSWSYEEDYPHVKYDLTYKNIGKKDIKVDLEVYNTMIKRDDALIDSLKYWKKLNVNFHRFILRPGQEKRLTGALRSNKLETKSKFVNIAGSGDIDRPMIVYPSKDQRDSFFKVTYLDSIDSQVINSDKEFLFSPKEEVLDKGYQLLTLIKYISRQNLEELNTGIALFFPDDKKSACRGEQTTHKSSKQFSDKTNASILRGFQGGNLTWEEVSIKSKAGFNSKEVKLIFEDFIKVCKKILDIKCDLFTTPKGNIKYCFILGDVRINAELNKSNKLDYFKATLKKEDP